METVRRGTLENVRAAVLGKHDRKVCLAEPIDQSLAQLGRPIVVSAQSGSRSPKSSDLPQQTSVRRGNIVIIDAGGKSQHGKNDARFSMNCLSPVSGPAPRSVRHGIPRQSDYNHI